MLELSESNTSYITTDLISNLLINVNRILSKVLYCNLLEKTNYNLPLYTAYISFVAIYCTIFLKAVHIGMFRHAINVVRNKYLVASDPGYTSHSQAIYIAALSSVGLGSVAGVSVSIVLGGPGVVFWLLIAAFLYMPVKFVEVSLGHKYREFNANGLIVGGPFLYIRKGLKEIGLKRIGEVIAFIYGIVMILNGLGGANMFQSNQTTLIIASEIPIIQQYPFLMGIIITSIVGSILVWNLKKVGTIAEKIVPFMTIAYILSSLTVIIHNSDNIIPAIKLIFQEAFKPKAAGGSIIAIISISFLRAAYATESGGGTSSIAHAASKTKEHIREGTTSFIEIMLSLSVCIITALTIIVTGAYKDATGIGGILVTKQAFVSIHPYFGKILAVCVFSLAVTTIIAWSYYGVIAWTAVFGGKAIWLFKVIFLSVTFYGCVAGNAPNLIILCDHLWALITMPNLVVLLLMIKPISKDLKEYTDKLHKGLFPCNEERETKLPFFK